MQAKLELAPCSLQPCLHVPAWLQFPSMSTLTANYKVAVLGYMMQPLPDEAQYEQKGLW